MITGGSSAHVSASYTFSDRVVHAQVRLFPRFCSNLHSRYLPSRRSTIIRGKLSHNLFQCKTLFSRWIRIVIITSERKYYSRVYIAALIYTHLMHFFFFQICIIRYLIAIIVFRVQHTRLCQLVRSVRIALFDYPNALFRFKRLHCMYTVVTFAQNSIFSEHCQHLNNGFILSQLW